MARTSAPLDPERQLMIKTKTCQRLLKEVNYYQKEVAENEATLAKMKAEQRDFHDIKKFEEVLGESYMMIPDSRRRFHKSLEDLEQWLSSDEFLAANVDTTTNEWFGPAEAMLKEHMANANCGDGQGNVSETNVSELKDGEVF